MHSVLIYSDPNRCRTCFDICEDDASVTSPSWKNHKESNSGSVFSQQKPSQAGDLDVRKYNGDIMERSSSVPKNIHVLGRQKFSSGSLLPEHVLSPYKHIAGDGER